MGVKASTFATFPLAIQMTKSCIDILSVYPVGEFLIGGGELGLVMLVLGCIYLIMSVIIMYWIKLQEFQAKYYVSDFDNNVARSVIFPVFVTVMWVNSFVNMYIGATLIIISGNMSYIHLILYMCVYGYRSWLGRISR